VISCEKGTSFSVFSRRTVSKRKKRSWQSRQAQMRALVRRGGKKSLIFLLGWWPTTRERKLLPRGESFTSEEEVGWGGVSHVGEVSRGKTHP